MIKPLTNIQSGWAQSFDTSGLVQAAYEAREKRRANLEKNFKQFDPSSIWYRDTKKFQEMYNDYLSTYSNLWDKASKNDMSAVMELKQKENNLLNFVAGSKGAEQMMKYAQNLMLSNPKYNNEENQNLLNGIITGDLYGGLEKGYESGDAFNNTFIKDFKRNINIDLSSAVSELSKLGTPSATPESSKVIPGTNQSRVKSAIEYPDDQIDQYAASTWENGDGKNTPEDLKARYGEDGLVDYRNDLYNRLPKYSVKDMSMPTEKDNSAEKNRFWVEKGATKQTVVNETGVDYQSGTTKRGAPITSSAKFTYDVAMYDPIKVGGTKATVPISGSVSGFRTDNGTYGNDIMKGVEDFEIQSVADAYGANKDIHFRNVKLKSADEDKTIDAKGYVAKKGTILSPEMIEAINNGNAYFIDKDGNEQTITPAGLAAMKQRYAFGRGTTKVSGLSGSDVEGTVNQLLEGVQHMSIAVSWDELKRKAAIDKDRINQIESMFSTSNDGSDIEDMIKKSTASQEY